MELNARIETAESVKEKAKVALGLDLSSALDLVKRSDYDSDEAYLDACARAEMERSSPEYRAARSRLKAEYRARQETEQRKAQDGAYKTIRANVSLDNLDRRNIDEQAADLARRDLAANRIPASELGATIERYRIYQRHLYAGMGDRMGRHQRCPGGNIEWHYHALRSGHQSLPEQDQQYTGYAAGTDELYAAGLARRS